MLLSIVDADLDPAEVEDALIRLRGELDEDAGVADVRTSSRGPSPAGSKAADGLLAALSVTITHPDVLAAVLEVVRGWAVRQSRTVRVEIDGDVLDLGRVTAAQQQQIIDAWLRHHRAGE